MYLAGPIARVVTAKDPLVMSFRCSPFDGEAVRNVKDPDEGSRIFLDVSIWLDDFGTTP